MDKKYNVIIHLNPVIDKETNKPMFAWTLWQDMGGYGQDCGDGLAETEQAAFDAVMQCYKEQLAKGD